MSSSRSIAAARQRRATEAPQQMQNRPRTSMNSAPAFNQPIQRQLPTQQRQPTQQQQQQQQQKYQEPPTELVQSKISISDAIGLITLRLGRLELSEMKKSKGDASGESSSLSDSVGSMNDVVVKSIFSRLEDLENNSLVKSFESKLSLMTDLVVQLQNELKDLKENVSNIEAFALEVNDQVVSLSEQQTVVIHDNAQLVSQVEHDASDKNSEEVVESSVSNETEKVNSESAPTFSEPVVPVVSEEKIQMIVEEKKDDSGN
jgi:hypothetical protein